MGKRINWFVFIIILLIIQTNVFAKVYYVDQNSPQANDLGPGTQEEPWKTISNAAMKMGPGDKVLIKGGIYRETVTPARSGTLEQPIIYEAMPGEEVIITGADIITGWEKICEEMPIYRTRWEYKFVNRVEDGVEIEYHGDVANPPLWGRIEQVIANGVQLLPTLNFNKLANNWIRYSQGDANVLKPPVFDIGGPFAGMFWADTSQHFLYIWLADGSDPNDEMIEASTRRYLFGAANRIFNHIIVRGITFRYAANFPSQAAVYLVGGSTNIVEDCLIEEMATAAIKVSGILRRTTLRKNGFMAGGAIGDGFLVEDCLWEENCWKPFIRGWAAGGWKLVRANGGIIRRSVFRRNGGKGLWLDIDNRDVLITENVFVDNVDDGLFVEISRNIIVVRNLAIRNVTGGGYTEAGIRLCESQNCIVAFNTVVNNKDGITLVQMYNPREVEQKEGGVHSYYNRNNVIIGNVIAYNHGVQIGLYYYLDFFKRVEKPNSEADMNIFIDRNLYAFEGTQRLALYRLKDGNPMFTTSLIEYSQYTGFDQGSFVEAPQFIDLENGNYPSKAIEMQVGWATIPEDILFK